MVEFNYQESEYDKVYNKVEFFRELEKISSVYYVNNENKDSKKKLKDKIGKQLKTKLASRYNVSTAKIEIVESNNKNNTIKIKIHW